MKESIPFRMIIKELIKKGTLMGMIWRKEGKSMKVCLIFQKINTFNQEINKRLNVENEKRDKFIGNLENKRKIIEKKEEFSHKR
jgi:hypothetical protein